MRGSDFALHKFDYMMFLNPTCQNIPTSIGFSSHIHQKKGKTLKMTIDDWTNLLRLGLLSSYKLFFALLQ